MLEVFLLALGIFVFAMSMLVIIAAILRRRDRAARKGGHYSYPACGHCGYNVHALPTTRCPECGSQLRAVGLEWRRE